MRRAGMVRRESEADVKAYVGAFCWRQPDERKSWY
jgi:hypothetical protein